jgi:hypothetical protein
MHKSYINLENFSHSNNFPREWQDGITHPLPRVLNMWWLHHGGSISCDHMVSPKGLSNGTQKHITCNIQAQNSNPLEE